MFKHKQIEILVLMQIQSKFTIVKSKKIKFIFQGMIERSQSCSKKVPNNGITQRQHFNYLRNNSCGIWGALSWGTNETSFQDHNVNLQGNYQSQRGKYESDYGEDPKQQANRSNRRVTFDQTNNQRGNQNKNQNAITFQKNNRNQKSPTDKKRPNSAVQKKSKLVRDEEAERRKMQENKQKVQKYIQDLRPYSRNLSNTKFQDYFQKAAPECYGRANINEPIGGVIYGNHLKTFNMNPHVYTNKPQNYQTHTTAINYGKRAKVCEDAKWKRLEKELSKKLGLKDKNQTIKQGKQVVYVDVDDSNKYQVLKQNHEFQKANRQQIHNRELEYKKQKNQQHLDDINQYYAKKQQKIANQLSIRQSIDMTGSNLSPQEFQAKLNQQCIYRYHDKHGNVRLAGDRHAMTCFVDMNFPENEAAYVEELKGRLPIYPVKVQGEDQYIDAIRKQNCKKGHEQIYPSHYLLRNCEEPEVLKMLSNKTGVELKKESGRSGTVNSKAKKVGVNSPTNNINKSFVSTTNTQNNQKKSNVNESLSYNQQQLNQNDYFNSLKGNKSEIIQRAWGNRQVAGEINNMNQTCCLPEHLPHNQKNPQCYRNSGVNVGRIPYAG